MTRKQRDSASAWIDPDDAPDLTEADMAQGTWRIGGRVVSPAEARKAVARRGRPAGSGTKESTTIRFDKDVLEAFKSGGPGWQSRMNAALREWLGKHPQEDQSGAGTGIRAGR